MIPQWFRIGALVIAGLVSVPLFVALPALAQHSHGVSGASPAPPAPTGESPRSVRIGMDELHKAGGVPPGWRFAWPAGDARKGREAYVKLECYQCHEVKGESFPAITPDPTRRGPGLTGVGSHHPAEYFAESILNPNAVIVTGPGHTGPDGLSIMPDFRDSLTLAETIDLVAYIRSLTGGDHAHDHAGASAERERVVGDYRVRLLYAAPGDGPDHHQHHGSPRPQAGHQHGGGASGQSPAHLMVFVSDAKLGEPVPYLPVTATIHAGAVAPRVVRLNPMLGGQGFHYGGDVTVPAATTKITVAIGKPALRLMPAAASRFARGVEVSFEWGK
jgi:uncharacterized protein involved in high-affinity Fe2+ transport